MKNILKFLKKDNIGKLPWAYDFLYNLPESEYPRYLAKIFNYRTGEKLPLKCDFKGKNWIIDKKRCKTFNQKIQWLKLYDVTTLKRDLTDKIKVRDYVKDRIGEEYLKPALQIIGNCSPSTSGRGRGEGITLAENDVSTYFDQINWEKLPQAFVIKCNHGCKWQYIIKNKDLFLQNKRLIEIVKRNITGWLEQDYSFWGGFEMQYKASHRVKSQGSISGARTRLCEDIAYDSDSEVCGLSNTKRINEPVYINQYELRKVYQEKGIEPKILIEPLMRDEINILPQEIEVYCFSGMPKYIIKLNNDGKISIWDEKLNLTDDLFGFKESKILTSYNDLIKQTFILSKQLSQNFCFVRVDWMIYQNKLYFEEMTFSPYSGFWSFKNKKNNKKLGNLINI